MSDHVGMPWSSAASGYGPIEVRLPADPLLVPAVRLMASGIAANARASVDKLDDIKLAVSEVLLALIEHGSAEALVLALEVRDSVFEISGCATTPGFDAEDPDFALCRTVLQQVCATHSIDTVGAETHIVAAVDLES